eukprot:scaffold661571_cov46-Prasinocladus_malaysianus.AAC.1
MRVEDDWLASGNCAKEESRDNADIYVVPKLKRYCIPVKEIADIVLGAVDGAEVDFNVLMLCAADRLSLTTQRAPGQIVNECARSDDRLARSLASS